MWSLKSTAAIRMDQCLKIEEAKVCVVLLLSSRFGRLCVHIFLSISKNVCFRVLGVLKNIAFKLIIIWWCGE